MMSLNEYIPIPRGYGRSIPIIAKDTISSFIKEKRFYISLVYYVLLPIFIVLGGGGAPVVQSGTGIAIYYAQLNTSFFVKTLFLTFFPGQIFLVILSSDQIAGELENDTLSLVLSKPTYHSEVVIGKYLGLLSILSILQIPSLSFIYYYNLFRYEAELPFAIFSSIDEVIGMFILIFITQSMILGLSLLISSLFVKSLYAILTSILSLFALSTISDIRSVNPENVNYFSLNYYIDAILPSMFFNLEPLESNPNIYSLFLLMVIVVTGFLVSSTLVLRTKELY